MAQAQQQESVSLAFLALLERLTPPERAVFLLREVFDYSYPEIAEIIGKAEPACRQIFLRAKKFIAANRPRFTPSTEQHDALLQRFMLAVGEGSIEGLIQLLAEDATLWADGGGRIAGAATRPVHGARSVARFILGSLRFVHEPYTTEVTRANGEPAVILRAGGSPFVFINVTISDGVIEALRVIGNPDKLRSLTRK